MNGGDGEGASYQTNSEIFQPFPDSLTKNMYRAALAATKERMVMRGNDDEMREDAIFV